jgi:hypothetical protein
MNLQLRGELLLAQTRGNAEEPQDPRIRRCEFENRQSFSELGRGMRSELGKQEGCLSSSHVV